MSFTPDPFEYPIYINCDASYDLKIESIKFLIQVLYILPGLVLNGLILITIHLKHAKIYGTNSFFVLFSVDCVVNTVILLTEGLTARTFIYLTPICPLVQDYFIAPLIGFKIVMILIHHSKVCKSIIQTLLVLNRMTCVLFPIRHEGIWRKNVRRVLIVLIFGIPLSVDWNLALSRVYMQSTYGGLWVNYFKKVSWASQSRFQLLFILPALSITLISTALTLITLAKLPERAKNLEKSISIATWIISFGFSCTAAFQIYYGFFFVYTTGSHPIFGLNFLSWDFLTVGSPIVMLCVSSTLRKHVFGMKNENTVTLMGVITNSTVLIAIRKTKCMNGSFGIITKNQVFCNIIMCSIFLFYVLPVQMSGSQLLIDYSHYFGTAAMTVYEISNGSHFLIALNRFCAIYMQYQYDKIFRNSTTIFLRNLLWLTSITGCIYFYEILQCNFFYNPDTYTFEFDSSDFCSKLTWYTDFTFNTVATVVTLVTNLLAAYKERKNSKNLLDIAGVKKSVHQRKREWNFIKQTCFQGLSIFLGQFAYYVIAPIIGDGSKVILFVLATLWAFMLAMEGGIILASNQEIRAIFKRSATTSIFIIGGRRSSGG